MRLIVVLGLCGLAGALGCDSGPPLVDAQIGAGSSLGRVTVQIAHNHDSDGVRTSASALFVRWRGVAADTVGALLALPGYGVEELADGECRVFDQASAMGDAAGGQADIQLLDAG